MEKILHKIYYNPETGFLSADKLYRKAKEQNQKITLKQVKDWLNKQDIYTTNKPKPKNIKYDSIISTGAGNNIQTDIMYSPFDKKYLLTAVDVYSRKAFVEPMMKKSAENTLKHFKNIRSKIEEDYTLNNVNTDAGSEFKGNFSKYLKENDIKQWVSDPQQDNKNAIVERFHRTLRGYLKRNKQFNKKKKLNDLQKLVKNYNNTYHGTIKHTPEEVWSGKEKNEQTLNFVYYDFEVGDKVRHLKNKRNFEKKSDKRTYTKSIFTISRIKDNSYFLKGNNGIELKKPFRGYELQKVE